MLRRLLLVLVVVALPGPAPAAPRAELWERWLAHDPASTGTVDHAPFARFLDRYLRPGEDGINRIAYGAVAAEDRAALDSYLAALAAAPVSRLARDEQMALWINLYNALTVQTVLDHYPVTSIRSINISPGLFTRGPWGAKLVSVEGEPLSLDDIEHRILRPIWRDPRIHYVVNCAAIGCPNLAARPYRADRLEQQLTRAALDFVNHPRAVRIENGRLVVSSIYHWYQEDFGGSEAGVIRHLLAHAEPGLAMRLQAFDRIARHHYDWALNDASP
jgi:hypothetical protein